MDVWCSPLCADLLTYIALSLLQALSGHDLWLAFCHTASLTLHVIALGCVA